VGKGASEVRPIVIARIKQLAFFNGSGVSPRERVDSEKGYLRLVMREIDQLKASASCDVLGGPPSQSGAAAAAVVVDEETEERIKAIVSSGHPRYDELHAMHGHDMLPMGKVNEGLTLAADLINVTFRNLTFSSGGSLEPIEKKIPSSMTISRLKSLVKQLFGLDPRLQQLSLRIYKEAVPLLLDDDQSTLQYFGAINGSDIFINEAKA
jgi:tubulin-specific chaperone E